MLAPLSFYMLLHMRSNAVLFMVWIDSLVSQTIWQEA